MRILKKPLQILNRLVCDHEWTKAQGYELIHYDVCCKCGKLRDTCVENVSFTNSPHPKEES